MKNKKILLALLITLVVTASGFIYKNNNGHYAEDKWSGTVSFVIIKIDTGKADDFSHTAWWNEKHEWRMEADIKDNFGIARSIIKGNRWGKSVEKLPPHMNSSGTDTTFGRGEDSTFNCRWNCSANNQAGLEYGSL